jgi:hypothetical protein
MKSNAFYLGLSALSNEATRFVQDHFGDSWFATVTESKVEFKLTRSGYKDVRCFNVVLNSDRVPTLEFPRVAINFPAAGNDSNFWIMRCAFEFMDITEYRMFVIRLFGKLTDLLDLEAGIDKPTLAC